MKFGPPGASIRQEFDRNSQTTYDGSGTTTADVHLILRGEGGTGKDTCWLETGPVGEADNGGQVTKPISYPGTDHDWGGMRQSVNEPRPITSPKTSPKRYNPLTCAWSFPARRMPVLWLEAKRLKTAMVGWSASPTTSVRKAKRKPRSSWFRLTDMNSGCRKPTRMRRRLATILMSALWLTPRAIPSLKPPKKVLKYTITLEDTSQEKGVDCNWPDPDRATTDYDMKIDPDNGWIKVTDDKGQSAETKQEGLTEFRVTINSYDWGGYTKLKVVAELEGGQSVVAHVRGHSDQDFLAIPKDDNQNHIADWWEHLFNLKNTDPSADDDDFPQGDGDKGDSIALYDEYRGFHIGGKHDRLSPETQGPLYSGLKTALEQASTRRQLWCRSIYSRRP